MDREVEHSTAGSVYAIRIALVGLIATHPDRKALADAMRAERETTLSWLLGETTPDRTIQALHDVLEGLGIDLDGDPDCAAPLPG